MSYRDPLEKKKKMLARFEYILSPLKYTCVNI